MPSALKEIADVREGGIATMSLEGETVDDRVSLTVDIISAFVTNNSVTAAELPSLIVSVHRSLTQLAAAPVEAEAPPLTPAVPIRRSIQQDYLICLEDGKKFKSLKRHLRTRYNLSPEDYRARWNLPDDYPMVAPSYAATRSELARTMGLGQQRRKWPSKNPAQPAAVASEPAPESEAPQRGRRKLKASTATAA